MLDARMSAIAHKKHAVVGAEACFVAGAIAILTWDVSRCVRLVFASTMVGVLSVDVQRHRRHANDGLMDQL
jgi:hypothetical protein